MSNDFASGGHGAVRGRPVPSGHAAANEPPSLGVVGDNWFDSVVGRIAHLRALQNRRDSMSKVKWETVPLHRVGSQSEQDQWAWALDLLVVDRVVHWSVENAPLSDVLGGGEHA